MADIPSEELARMAKQNRGPEIIAIVSSFMAFAIIAVGFRLFTRLKITNMFGSEDTFIVLATVSSILLGAFQIKQVEWGTGRYQIFLDYTATKWMLIYLYCSILAYNLGLFFVRFSILLQYRRIFVTWQEIWTPNTIAMFLCIGYGIESTLIGIFHCTPVDAFWDLKKGPTASCVNDHAWYYANAGINVGIDFFIAALPVRAIWQLHIPVKQKIAVQLILTVGWFICIVSILRLLALIVMGNHPEDIAWYGAAAAYFSAIEVNLAIVCASLPALKPLIAKVVPGFLSRQLTTRRHANRPTISECPSFVHPGGSQSWNTTIESRHGNGSEEHLRPPSSWPPNRIIVMKKFERHSYLA